MAGCSTPELAAAVSEAGALGSVAAGMLTPDDLRTAIQQVRARTDAPFAVNLFAPQPPPSERGVAAWSQLTGVTPPERPAPISFDDQLAVIVAERAPVFSFTFGIVALAAVDAVKYGTATTVAEAVELERAGVDAVVAQGYEAGGHRGTFLGPVDRSLIGTLALVPQVVDAIGILVVGRRHHGRTRDRRGARVGRPGRTVGHRVHVLPRSRHQRGPPAGVVAGHHHHPGPHRPPRPRGAHGVGG